MGYILKNTSGLINTKLTDTARQMLSQGKFNISYFQVGDSEMLYNYLPPEYPITDTMILESGFNAQNSSGSPESNKQNVKYPYYVDGDSGNTYGIPYMDSVVSPIYNTAAMRGFFTGDTSVLPTSWSVLTGNDYVKTSNYVINMSSLTGGTEILISQLTCNPTQYNQPGIGDFVTIYFDNMGSTNCNCYNVPTPTPTSTPNGTPSPTPSVTPTNGGAPCASPTPTPSVTSSYCPNPTPTPPKTECLMSMSSCYPILTYRIVDVCTDKITLDRATPDFSNINFVGCYARIVVYPKKITDLYDSVTPLNHYSDDIINFESVCAQDEFDVKIWNMNIPWSESLAGIDSNSYKDYSEFGSVNYLSTKEYLGYMSKNGQTFFISNQFSAETTDTYYYNSFNEIIKVEPEEQKAIGIIHYTNQAIDLFYGEKFAFQPYDDSAPYDTTGQARNFKLHLPWLMWHKNPECCLGETFWVDPPGFDDPDIVLFEERYIQSTKNEDMNSPGIRYYHLWDTNINPDGFPNRVGKVFPDDRIIVIDDEELLAAMSYKSNRNWTLPAVKLFLSTPNTCNSIGSNMGILTGSNETLFVTYRFTNTTAFTNSLHCNYYTKITGPNDCNPSNSENVGVRFGGNLGCLDYYENTFKQGFFGEKLEILCQKVPAGTRPQPEDWRVIDFTDSLTANTINGYITQDSLTGTTFIITKELYDDATINNMYDLGDYIDITQAGESGPQLNFGDEYYFYGALETDIQATIYEMVYKLNLSNTEFQTPSNPTWTTTTKPYITELGLYDSDKNLMIVSKLQSPVLRQGIQQFLIKFDF
jgi:hypothetical protein